MTVPSAAAAGMERLSDMTIVTLSYGRQAYLLRQMGFWSGLPATLHVLDGSEDGIDDDRLAPFGRRIHYHHIPNSVFERVAIARELVETSYVAFLADDDFFIPSSLCSCIDQIEKEGLVACLGLSIIFYHEEGQVYGKNRMPTIRGFSSAGQSPLGRMKKMMRPGLPIPYAVQRRDAFRNATSKYPENMTSCTLTPEIQYRMLLGCQGETRAIDELMWLNSHENPCVRAEGWNRNNNVISWFSDPKTASEVESFFQTTIDAMRDLGGRAGEGARRDLEETVGHYLASKMSWKRRRRSQERLLDLCASAAHRIPDALKKVLRPWFAASMDAMSFDGHRAFSPLMEAGAELAREGAVVDMEWLAEIEEKIRSFHETRAEVGR